MQAAEWRPTGRDADMFSLGCVLLEILTLNREGTLDRLTNGRSLKNTAFHANLDQIDNWLPKDCERTMKDAGIDEQVREMLSFQPTAHCRWATVLSHRLR